jgi:hypothetical protein
VLNREAFAVTFLPHGQLWSDDFKLKLLNSNGFSECDLGLDHLVFSQMLYRGDVRHRLGGLLKYYEREVA